MENIIKKIDGDWRLKVAVFAVVLALFSSTMPLVLGENIGDGFNDLASMSGARSTELGVKQAKTLDLTLSFTHYNATVNNGTISIVLRSNDTESVVFKIDKINGASVIFSLESVSNDSVTYGLLDNVSVSYVFGEGGVAETFNTPDSGLSVLNVEYVYDYSDGLMLWGDGRSIGRDETDNNVTDFSIVKKVYVNEIDMGDVSDGFNISAGRFSYSLPINSTTNSSGRFVVVSDIWSNAKQVDAIVDKMNPDTIAYVYSTDKDGTDDVVFCKMDKNFSNIITPVVVTGTGGMGSSEIFPVITQDSLGNFYVVYLSDFWMNTGEYQLYAVKLSNNGSVAVLPQQIDLNENRLPSIYINPPFNIKEHTVSYLDCEMSNADDLYVIYGYVREGWWYDTQCVVINPSLGVVKNYVIFICYVEGSKLYRGGASCAVLTNTGGVEAYVTVGKQLYVSGAYYQYINRYLLGSGGVSTNKTIQVLVGVFYPPVGLFIDACYDRGSNVVNVVAHMPTMEVGFCMWLFKINDEGVLEQSYQHDTDASFCRVLVDADTDVNVVYVHQGQYLKGFKRNSQYNQMGWDYSNRLTKSYGGFTSPNIMQVAGDSKIYVVWADCITAGKWMVKGRTVYDGTPVVDFETRDIYGVPTTSFGAGETVFIVDKGSSFDPDGILTKYKYEYGEMGFTNTLSSNSTGYKYTGKGLFIITVTGYDDNDHPSLKQQIAIRINNSVPVADIVEEDMTVEAGEIVNFHSNNYDADEDDVLICHWDFGDGNSFIGESAYHIYNLVGTYNVTLGVTDGFDYGYDSIKVTVGEVSDGNGDGDGNVTDGNGFTDVYNYTNITSNITVLNKISSSHLSVLVQRGDGTRDFTGEWTSECVGGGLFNKRWFREEVKTEYYNKQGIENGTFCLKMGYLDENLSSAGFYSFEESLLFTDVIIIATIDGRNILLNKDPTSVKNLVIEHGIMSFKVEGNLTKMVVYSNPSMILKMRFIFGQVFGKTEYLTITPMMMIGLCWRKKNKLLV